MSQGASRTCGRTYRQRQRERVSETYQEPATCSRHSALGPDPDPSSSKHRSTPQSKAKQSELNSKLAIPMRPFILFILIVVVFAVRLTNGRWGRTDDRVFILFQFLFACFLFLFHFVFVNAVFYKLFHSIVCGDRYSVIKSRPQT